MSFKPSNFYEFTVAANAAYVLTVSGEYFKVMSVDGAINIKADWGELRGLIAGQGLESSPFARLLITNENPFSNKVRLFIGDEKFIDGIAGQVDVATAKQVRSTAFTNTQKTVTNASGQLLPGNGQRQYLLIQNNDATGVLWISFGVPAVVGAGVRVIPGGSFELPGTVTTGEVYAIGSVANNPNVVVVEG